MPLLFSLLASIPLNAQQLEWEAAIAEISPVGNSYFTEVEAAPGDGSTTLDRAIACGHFTGNFNIGPHTLINSSGQDGVVALFLQQNAVPFNWDADWLAHANSTAGNVVINDITPGPGGEFFVCGVFSEDVTFSGSGTTLSSPGASAGFVAWGNITTGDFINAFITIGMEPAAIAIGNGGNIYVTGDSQLIRRYPAGGGAPNWNVPSPAGTTDILGLALPPDPLDPSAYVLIQNNMGSNLEVTTVKLDRAMETVEWTARAGGSSSGDDFPGGIAVGNDNQVRVAFSTQNNSISYQSPTATFTLPNIPTNGASHGVLLRIDQAGELVWSTPLGTAQNATSSMKPTSIAVDEAGNTYCAAAFDGQFIVESVPELGNIDTAVLAVDAAGLLFDFQRSQGPGLDSPAGVAAPIRDLVVTVGSFTDGNSVFGPATLNAPGNPTETRAFISALGPIPGQDLLILTPDGSVGAPTIPQLVAQVHGSGGQLYTIVRNNTAELAVSAWLTTDQLTSLIAPGGVLVEMDVPLGTAGSSTDAGWALDHINDATTTNTAPFPYSYADTANTVNVYLIDTAVDNSSGWFDTNANLTIEATTLVRGSGDPLVSSVFQHGTEMLSLIGGPDTGVALGTPIVLKNFDFYPNGEPSTASLLADAIYQAIDYHLDFGDCAPGVILVSSSGAGSSATISTAIAEAITEGITVIVSAGNSNVDASTFVPAASGTTSGVICVGASDASRAKESGSNHTTIDLSAPGDAVRVIDYSAPLGGSYGSFTGTSASAAYTAGVAACHLSINPWSTPAELETAIFGDTYTDGGLDILQLAPAGATFTQTYNTWTAYYELSDTTHAGDDDGDGWNNLSEYFHGLKPTVADPKGAQSWISYDDSTGKYLFTFNISTALLDTTSLGSMLDGGSYEVTDSTTATGFTSAPGTLTVGSSTGKQTTLKLENTVVDPKCFMHVEVTPALPSP